LKKTFPSGDKAGEAVEHLKETGQSVKKGLENAQKPFRISSRKAESNKLEHGDKNNGYRTGKGHTRYGFLVSLPLGLLECFVQLICSARWIVLALFAFAFFCPWRSQRAI